MVIRLGRYLPEPSGLFRRSFPDPKCGSWQVVHRPTFSPPWEAGLSRAGSSWQAVQVSMIFFLSSDFSTLRCGSWHSEHCPCLTGV